MQARSGSIARRTRVALAFAILVSAALVPIGVAQTGTDQPARDNTVSRIEVTASGDARYVLQVRTALDEDGAVATYERFQERFRNDTEAYLGTYRERMRGVVSQAGERLDRPMNATNFSARTSIQSVPRQWGVVTFVFTWENFARQDGDAVVVGDVFRGGLLLTEDDALEVVAPEGYEAADVSPAPDERDDQVLTWHGREDFADGHPRVRFAESSGSATGLLLPAGVVLATILVGAGVYVAVTRRGSTAEPSLDTPTVADPDQQRVIDAIAAAGGRTRQSDLVDELPWSKSKTSRLLSSLEAEGYVEKREAGRENVVELA